MELTEIIIGSVGALLGIAGILIVLRGRKMVDIERTQEKANEILEKSENEVNEILENAKERSRTIKLRAEEDKKQREELISKMEESLSLKQSSIDKKNNKFKEVKIILSHYEEEVKKLEEKVKILTNEITQKLAQKANQTPENAKKELINKLEKELEIEKKEKLQFMEDALKETAAKTAEKVMVNAIQRLTSATSVERRMINIKVKRDKMKGKIVGKGGKNIQYFEAKLGVDVIFNDQPNTISVSAFNLVNRKIAERAIKVLLKQKGEINEEVIDKAIKNATEETDKDLLTIGKKAIKQAGFKTEDKELLRTIGRLQYRTSYGQNIMLHSLEVGWLAVMMGTEIGLDEDTLKKGGFLHDLGKAIDQDPNVKDTHDVLTKEIMEKHGFTEKEIHAAWTHHDAISIETAEAMMVKAADAISASRPGARQESMDKYIQRLKDLEGTAGSYAGVKKAFAISAGRELRVIVRPEEIKDLQLVDLAHDIAKDVEENITYPGKVKINVIRKTKSVDVAKQESYN